MSTQEKLHEPTILGKMVRDYRKSLGLNQTEFALLFGRTTPTAVSFWESGFREIPGSLCIALIDSAKREGITGDTSDGYHTFNELYDYRRVYNAKLFNEWALREKYDVHKSWKHSDGNDCFGGGWFVVVAELPTGQITNHYEAKYWDDFAIPEKPTANKYDGHTPQEVLDRIAQLEQSEESI